MNFYVTFGIFVVLLSACFTPIQSQTFDVLDVVLENGERYVTNPQSGRFIKLIRLPDSTYEIKETVTEELISDAQPSTQTFPGAILKIKNFRTMLGEVIVVDTDCGFIQMELRSKLQAQQLFDLTARPNLFNKLYSYKLSAVYEYDKSYTLEDVSITGYTDSVPENPQIRFIIHSGDAFVEELEPHLLWTARNFNYCVHDMRAIVLTLAKPADGTFHYYLVKSDNPLDLIEWKKTPGTFYLDGIPEAPFAPTIRQFL